MAKKTGKKKEESLVMVGDDGELDEDLPEEEEEESEDGGEDEEGSGSRQQKSKKEDPDEDESSDEEDERVGHGEDDEEEEEDGSSKRRERESRKARRERQRKARQRNEVELNFLRQQNEQLEKRLRETITRVDQSEVTALDQRINSIQSQLKVADQVFARAVKSGDEDDIAQATNIRDKLRDNLGKLNGAKQELSRRTEESSQEPAVDSKLVYHASRWMRENSWYDPNGRDADSKVVAAIDNRLVSEGYDPRTPEYWEELTDRVQSRLPHKFKDRRSGHDDDDDLDEDDDRRSRGSEKDRRGSGPRFSTGGRERPLRKNEVYVSPERKQAMIDAGVWDDPVLRKKYLRTYQKWDQENGGGRRSAR